MLDLFGLGRVRQLNVAEAQAQQAQRSAEHLEEALSRLEDRFDKLSSITMALWSIVKEKSQCTDADLNHRVEMIMEMRQQEAQAPQTCPQCGRSMLARAHRCLYCDYHAPENDTFTKVIR